MSAIEVLKFGGTSVKTVGRLQHVAQIVADRTSGSTKKLVVVVSAMGDTTDYLSSLARQCSASPDKRELDVLLSTGEQTSIALLSLTLKSMGVRAKSFTGQQLGILTDGKHTDARILDINARAIEDELIENDVLVVAGFQGINYGGDITTLGRGGSDTTAVALAAACGNCDCDIYTDVDGVFTADPNKIASAELTRRISYDEVIALARHGAQVLHRRAVELAKHYNIKLRVRNTFKPEDSGTIIEGGEMLEPQRKVSGVAVDSHVALIGVHNVPESFPILKEIAGVLKQEQILVEQITLVNGAAPSQPTKSAVCAIRAEDAERALALLSIVKSQCEEITLVADFAVVKVTVVGSAVGSDGSLASRVISLLDQESVSIKLFSSNENSLSCWVQAQSAQLASQLLHDELCLTTDTGTATGSSTRVTDIRTATTAYSTRPGIAAAL